MTLVLVVLAKNSRSAMAKISSRFFAFEGIDGCGKSTQIESLQKRLEEQGHTVVRIREPGGTSLSEDIRNLLLTPREEKVDDIAELFLFNAARAQLLNEVVRPALEAGHVVLADRFAWSTMAYQAYGRGIEKNLVKSILDIAVGDLWPSKTIYLDLDLQESRRRLAEGREAMDRMELEKEDFFAKVLQGYRDMALQYPQMITTYNASDSIDELAKSIGNEVLNLL